MSAPTPPIIVKAFAADADPAYITQIPETTADPERASLDLGFPPQTMQPVIAGGTPPFGQDVNGILNMLSAHTVAQQAGQQYVYDPTLLAEITGYQLGAVLGMDDGSGLWLNRSPNNATDPDANGAGWVPAIAYGATTKSGLTGGTLTLTRLEARYKLIILQGTLTSNLQVVFPNTLQDWLIANQTTGAYTITAKTQAGTGVTIPQGGLGAPTGVYGDTVNLNPTVAPLSVPIDEAATPSTIPKRTNQGYILATRFNQSAGYENATPITGVWYEASTDGFLRKMTLTAFESQMLLQNIGGAVTSAQVPLGAVTQYAAALFNNPAFTGTPTAPTAGVGTNTAQVATTQFVMTQALGNGQAWSNPTRAINTPYTNTTGRAIQVSVGLNLPSGTGGNVTIDGVLIASNSAGGGATERLDCCPTVPPGAVYQVSGSGSASIEYWAELS